MKKHCRILFVTTLLLLALFSCKEESLNLSPENTAWNGQTRAAIESLNANGMRVLSSSESSLVMELEVSNYAKNAVSIEGKDYFSITARDAHSMLQKGNPDLPEYAYSVVIPQTSACNVRVVKAEYEDITLPVAPSKGGIISSNEPYTFSEVYEKDAFYPTKLATTDAPFLMRDIRGSVVRLHPFQYNPVTGILRVYKKMEVEVSFSGTDNRNVLTSGVRHTIDKSMEELFRAQFINYDVMAASTLKTLPPIISAGNKGVKGPPLSEQMLIICCDSFATNMGSFMSHKSVSYIGISTRLVTMSQVGTDAEDVAQYIKDDYEINRNLTYVLLVGNAERVPTKSLEDEGSPSELGGADPMYALVSGTDSIPDIYIGRFSARNCDEVQTMVSRTIYYEMNMSPVQTWQHKSIGMCDGWTNNAPDDNYVYMNSILEMLDYSVYGTGGLIGLYGIYPSPWNSGYTNATTIYLPTISDTSSAINDGAFIVNYIGDGFWNTWNVNGNNDIPGSLENDRKLPFVYSASPGVGDLTGCNYFSTQPCFAERWLTARNSTTGAETGAIGFYGSSIGSLNYGLISAALNFNSMLTSVTLSTRNFGVLCYESAKNMRNQLGNAANYILLKWNYFGDPSLAVIPNDYTTP